MFGIPTLYSLFARELSNVEEKVFPAGEWAIRLEKELDGPVRALDWLTSFDLPEQFYFSGRSREYQIAGLGESAVFSGSSQKELARSLNLLWKQDSGFKVFGGLGFFHSSDFTGEWEGFGQNRFTLPLVELNATDKGARMALNLLARPGEALHDVVSKVAQALKSLDEKQTGNIMFIPPAFSLPEMTPDFRKWSQMVEKALEQIQSGEVQKVVLSRKTLRRTSSAWDIVGLFHRYANLGEDSFVFLYRTGKNSAFMGRPPERLFRIQEGRLTVDAIAGTRPRGTDQESDRSLAEELLHSEKDLEEHRIVSDHEKSMMYKVCKNVKTIRLEKIMKLKKIQHIVTTYSGEVKKNCPPLDMLRFFHPTPAVGGLPRGRALEILQNLEPFERGWFAAPIGWMNQKEGDFAVGIRSALINGRDLHVFAGAGIVGLSNPEAEWWETEQKMSLFSEALGDA